MKIEYENKFSDILLFNTIHQFLSPVNQGFYLLFFLFILLSEFIHTHSVYFAIIIATIWYIAVWVIQFIFNVFYLYFGKSKSVLTKHIVEIQDESFYEETKYNKSYFFWNDIIKVVRRFDFILVYVTPNAACIIPKRAFSSELQMDSFINECINKIKATRK